MACVTIEMQGLGEEELEVREKQKDVTLFLSFKNILYKDIEVENL